MDIKPLPQFSNKLTRRRAGALAALLVALIAYGAGAEHLPGLPSGIDVVFHSAVVFPAFAAAIWIALPLARVENPALLAMAALVAGRRTCHSRCCEHRLSPPTSRSSPAMPSSGSGSSRCSRSCGGSRSSPSSCPGWTSGSSRPARPSPSSSSGPGSSSGSRSRFRIQARRRRSTSARRRPLRALSRGGRPLRTSCHVDVGRDDRLFRHDARPSVVVGRHRRIAGPARHLSRLPSSERRPALAKTCVTRARPPARRGRACTASTTYA